MRTCAAKPTAGLLKKAPGFATARTVDVGRNAALDPVVDLQRTIGNQAVLRLLGARPPLGIQRKLTVNAPGDVYEQEADRVADAVVGARKGAGDEDEPTKVEVAEKCACAGHAAGEDDVVRRSGGSAGGALVEPDTATRLDAMRGDGRPLSSSEREFMEPRFGTDFGGIRIHTSHEADAHSRALDARAFTLGSDIYFRAREYTPGDADSRRLLAHELTHTIQQGAVHRDNGRRVAGSTAVPRVQRQPPPGPAPAPPAPAPPAPAPAPAPAPPVPAPAPAPAPPAPAPAPAPVVVPAGRASVNFVPVVVQAPNAGAWGDTWQDTPVVDITAYANGANWSCVITTADQQCRQGVRLLAGVVEVTNALVAAESDCGKLKTMSTSLSSVASQGAHSGFYMLSAVQAHENLHITQYRNALAPAYSTLKATVEALTVPTAGSADAAAAKAAIKALPAYTAAIATFNASHASAQNNTASHTPMAPFNAVEHAVVDPMVGTIAARRTALSCAP